MTDKNTAFPVRKMLWLSEQQWEQVSKFRHKNMIGSEAEALRQLIKLGIEHSKPTAPPPSPSQTSALQC